MSTFVLPFPISVNAMFADGKTRRFKSQRYCDWILEAGLHLNRQKPQKVSGPVTLLYEFQDCRDKRKRDLGNLEKGVTDLLVKHGVIQADDNTIVREIKLKWAADVEGVRVTVSEFFNRVPDNTKGNAEAA